MKQGQPSLSGEMEAFIGNVEGAESVAAFLTPPPYVPRPVDTEPQAAGKITGPFIDIIYNYTAITSIELFNMFDLLY